MIDLNKCAELALNNAIERQKNGAKINARTLPMLKHCATEVIEATESYGYVANEIPRTIDDIELPVEEMHLHNESHFASELADIICCVLIIAQMKTSILKPAYLGVLKRIEKEQKEQETRND